MNEINPYLEIIRAGVATVCGAVAGGLTAHFLTKQRDRAAGLANRKREFMGFLRGWQFEFSREFLEVGGFGRRPQAFTDQISHFVTLAEGIRGDFTEENRERFQALTNNLAARDATSFHNEQNYESLNQAVDELIAFVEEFHS